MLLLIFQSLITNFIYAYKKGKFSLKINNIFIWFETEIGYSLKSDLCIYNF